MTINCVNPAFSLTKEFSPLASIQGWGSQPWECLLSLLKTAPTGERAPLIKFESLRPVWIQMLEGHRARDKGMAISKIWDDFCHKSICPPEIMITPMLGEAARTLPAMQPINLKKMVYALSGLAIDPGQDILLKIADRTKELASKFDEKTLIHMIHALTIMDAVQEHRHGKSRVDLSGTYGALLEKVSFSRVSEPAYIDVLARSAKWFGFESLLELPLETDESSLFERATNRTLCDVGAIELPSRIFEQLEHRIDLTHEFAGKVFHTECDGIPHVVMSEKGKPSHMNGQTILQTGLLRPLLQEPLVRLSYPVFERKRHCPEYWERFLEMIGTYSGKTCLFLNGGKMPELHMIGHADRFAP